jgi:hypothetical protein
MPAARAVATAPENRFDKPDAVGQYCCVLQYYREGG